MYKYVFGMYFVELTFMWILGESASGKKFLSKA